MDQAEKEEREREREVVDQCSDNDSNQRLIITKIVCKDFKSYAGVQELGPFHKVHPYINCLTGIVVMALQTWSKRVHVNKISMGKHCYVIMHVDSACNSL